jgi:hypothetical protein
MEGCQEARGVDSGCAREAAEDLVATQPGSGREAPGFWIALRPTVVVYIDRR